MVPAAITVGGPALLHLLCFWSHPLGPPAPACGALPKLSGESHGNYPQALSYTSGETGGRGDRSPIPRFPLSTRLPFRRRPANVNPSGSRNFLSRAPPMKYLSACLLALGVTAPTLAEGPSLKEARQRWL